ncbi:zinc-binding dehydrogenase [Streptomyces sp. NBC_00690]|uniref:zinc-binding dehydrogenase n=1 Tax=Streptomyces sp. NBC_00690 TaxID=2975808 RepID=UPI002E2BBA09|nr:zinc-binding dehydrogenase [Streptomyces sp. NBC_00690]
MTRSRPARSERRATRCRASAPDRVPQPGARTRSAGQTRQDPGAEFLAAAAELGTRIIQIAMRYDRMSEFARLADEGVLVVSVARTYTLDQIQEAAKLSQSCRPGGKLMLVL